MISASPPCLPGLPLRYLTTNLSFITDTPLHLHHQHIAGPIEDPSQLLLPRQFPKGRSARSAQLLDKGIPQDLHPSIGGIRRKNVLWMDLLMGTDEDGFSMWKEGSVSESTFLKVRYVE